jgi:UDP-3-O-acyl-N-acetylglucosamine deacetylase
MAKETYGAVLIGDEDGVRRAYARFSEQAVDQEFAYEDGEKFPAAQTTIVKPVAVTGPGTFFGKAQRTLRFEPSLKEGWWFYRQDVEDAMPILVSVNNIWTTIRNIVLCSGSPHNYMRMVEHIIALKVGMGVDNLMIRVDSGDPPLFDRGSMDLVDAIEAAGITTGSEPVRYLTVKEPVTVGGQNGGFLTVLPAEGGNRRLLVDCAVDFKSAIGKQRIRFPVTRDIFRHGAPARTNTTIWRMIYSKTIGQLFADVRNLGYTTKNIQVAGRWRYFNKPGLVHNGKSLEPAWHRATLDLLGAVALIDKGRLAGKIVSYKSGHTLDVQMIRELYQRDLLCAM